MKISGATYQEIAAKGGGILNSATVVQGMSEDDVLEHTLPRAWEIIKGGTGAVEIKSGYGLTLKDELKTRDKNREELGKMKASGVSLEEARELLKSRYRQATDGYKEKYQALTELYK